MTGTEPANSATSQSPGQADEAPLAGLKVVELSMYVQGPVAGLALASLGADVVKIERVGHMDQMRSNTALRQH